MKLIQVSSTDDQSTGIIQSNYKTPITLEPMSKIALLNASISLSADIVTTSGDINIVYFKSDEQAVKVSVPFGSYSVDDLRDVLEQVLNTSGQLATVEQNDITRLLGLMWISSYTKSNDQLTIQFKSVLDDESVDVVKDKAGENLNYPNFTEQDDGSGKISYGTTATSSGNNFRYIYSGKDVCMGSQYLQCRVKTGTGTSVAKQLLGYLDPAEIQQISGNQISWQKLAFGIVVLPGTNDNYRVIYTDAGLGVRAEDTKTAAAVDDTMCIQSFGVNKIAFGYFRAGTFNVLKTLDFADQFKFADSISPHKKPYRVIMGTTGAGAGLDATVIDEISLLLNPYQQTLSVGELGVVEKRDQFADKIVSDSSAIPIYVNLNFEGSLARELGFTRTNFTTTAVQDTFTASNEVSEADIPASLSVEISNLGRFNSYDNSGRQQSVGIIPLFDMKHRNLSYNNSSPVYVEMNNKNPIIVSQLVLRIIDTFTGQPVVLDGQGTSLSFGITNSPQN